MNTPGARTEIWAYGLRNPRWLTRDVDPANAGNNYLIADVIGLHTWETVIIVHKRANYGYSLREGDQQLNADNSLSPIPEVDRIPVQIDETKTAQTVAPAYPVIEYGHVPGGIDAISNWYVHRGKAFPALQGKYLFGGITTGRIWWADFKGMLALDAAKNPKNTAQMHEVSILWDRPEGGKELYPTMAPITLAGYHARGGTAADLPGRAPVSGGRSDICLAIDATGNLYILSETDGMIREVVGVTSN